MGHPAEEKEVFNSFVSANPLFAGAEITSWLQPEKDWPDVECNLVDGRKIGVELTSWLSKRQIGRAKRSEMLEAPILDAIRPEPSNETDHISALWMFPKRRMLPRDAASFRTEVLRLTESIDRRWDSEKVWHAPQGFLWKDFKAYPILRKYLEAIDIHPRIPGLAISMEKGSAGWLGFAPTGGGYSPDRMVNVLCDRVRAKISKYADKPPGVDEFYLLVHYDKAQQYNTRLEGIDYEFPEAIERATATIGRSVGVFDKIFVYVPITQSQQVFSLYPHGVG